MLGPILSRHRDTDDAKAVGTEAAPPYSVPTTVTYLGSITKWGGESGTHLIASGVTFNDGDYLALLICTHDGTSANTSPTAYSPSGPWTFGTPDDRSAPATADASGYYIISHIRIIPITSTATGDLYVDTPSTVYGNVVHAYKVTGGTNIVIDDATYTGTESNGTSLTWTNPAEANSPYLAAVSTTAIGDSTPWAPTSTTIDNTSSVGSVIEGRACRGTLASGATSISMDNANTSSSASCVVVIFKASSTGGSGGGGGGSPSGNLPWLSWIAAPTDTAGQYELPPASRIVSVSTTTQLVQALSSAQPGDHIVMEPGSYGMIYIGQDTPSTIAGTASKPIVIRSRTLLSAKWSGFRVVGTSRLDHVMIYGVDLSNLNYMTIRGSYFTIRRCRIQPRDPYITGTGEIKYFMGIQSEGLRYFRLDHCNLKLQPPSFSDNLIRQGGRLPTGSGRLYITLRGKWESRADFTNSENDEYWIIFKNMFEGGVTREHYSQPAALQFSKASSLYILNHSDFAGTPSHNFYFGKCLFTNGGWPLDINTKIRKSWWDRCQMDGISSWSMRNGLYWIITRTNANCLVEIYTRRTFFHSTYINRLNLTGSIIPHGVTYEAYASDNGWDTAWWYGSTSAKLHHCTIGTVSIGSTGWPYAPRDIEFNACTISTKSVYTSSNGEAPQYTENTTSTFGTDSPVSLTTSDVGTNSVWETPPGFSTMDNVDWSQLVPTTGVP